MCPTISIDPLGKRLKDHIINKKKNRNQNLVEKAPIIILYMLMEERLQLINVDPKQGGDSGHPCLTVDQ
jgi:hypothetical protein